MIGVGIGIPIVAVALPNRHRVLDMTPQERSEIVKLLVRYRIARKAPWFIVGPCDPGLTHCIRSTTP